MLAAVMFGAASGAEAGDLLDLPILRGALTDGLNSRPANWQGAYVGVQGGYGTSNMNFSGSTRTIAASLLSGTEMENQQQISSWPIMGKVSVHGSGWGGFAGYNSQWDDVVVGFEASYLHGSFGGSQTDSMSRFFSLPSGSTGSVRMAALATGAYARIRKQFGMSIGRFEGIEEALARIGGLTYAVSAVSRMTAAAVDQGEKPAVPSAIAKYHATELGRAI
ncbi:MAG: acyl-CoA dehydrogenase family protein, partial [Rubrivivax sp.]|nr:acyl-CoA dehydrogenase family protein [Rubrivivax sp.]